MSQLIRKHSWYILNSLWIHLYINILSIYARTAATWKISQLKKNKIFRQKWLYCFIWCTNINHPKKHQSSLYLIFCLMFMTLEDLSKNFVKVTVSLTVLNDLVRYATLFLIDFFSFFKQISLLFHYYGSNRKFH